MWKMVIVMNRKRDVWVDRVKTIACILVVLGHFFQSMVTAGLMGDTALYHWFNRSIYYFHVPLFFICSGFLYQKYSRVDSLTAWKYHVAKKAIAFGIPYFVFSLATWILKNVFSGSVNSQTEGLFRSLFVNPISPYWYLYALFFLFLLIPTFRGARDAATAMVAALVLKIANIFIGTIPVYAVDTVMQNALWFVLGMNVAVFGWDWKVPVGRSAAAGAGLLIVFLAASVFLTVESGMVSLGMGLLGCAMVMVPMIGCTKERILLDDFSKFTMPVFLMHTIFAAGLRSVLFQVGIENRWVHIFAGLAIGFMGPIVAIEIMKRIKLDVLVYPGRYIKIKTQRDK